jgi:glycine cleavage system H protein
MEDINMYKDIFETKGIEYIIIIFFLLLLIPFWFKLNQVKVVQKITEQIGNLTAAILKIPKGILFCKNHTWTHLEKSGTAKMGIDDFLLKTIGKSSIKGLKSRGEKIKKGDLIAEMHQDHKTLNIYSPISGEIKSINPILENDSNIADDNVYEKYWIYSIEPSNWQSETQSFYMADAAIAWSKNELAKLKDWIMKSMANTSPGQPYHVLQEGGELQINPLAGEPKEVWSDFQKEFLNNVS